MPKGKTPCISTMGPYGSSRITTHCAPAMNFQRLHATKLGKGTAPRQPRWAYMAPHMTAHGTFHSNFRRLQAAELVRETALRLRSGTVALCTSGSCADSGCTSFLDRPCNSHRLPFSSSHQEGLVLELALVHRSSTGTTATELSHASHAKTIITRKDTHCGHSRGTQRRLGTTVQALCEDCPC